MESLWKGIGNARTEDIERMIKGKWVFLGAVQNSEGEKAIVIAMDGQGIEALRTRQKYT